MASRSPERNVHVSEIGLATFYVMGDTGCQVQSATRTMQGGPVYATVVVGHAGTSQANGSHKPVAKGLISSEIATVSDVANRCMSPDMSGTLRNMPVVTITTNAQMACKVVPAEEQRSKMPIFVTGLIDIRGFLAWWRTRCSNERRNCDGSTGKGR